MTQERQKLYRVACILCAVILITAAVCGHYLFDPWGFYWKVSAEETALRLQVVEAAEGWLGANEADGSHQPIIDQYNAHEPLAVGYTVHYTDSWCSAFVSSIAIQCGLTDIIPTECGCQRHIGLFQEIGRWEEQDSAIPLPGDIIFYDWDETKPGDAAGWSDHVGIVVGTKWPFIKVIEGNYDDRVQYRIIPLWDIRIRGYGKPDYAAAAKTP